MRTITKQVYTFSELSESAKRKAMENYGRFDDIDADFLTEQFEQELEEYGFPDAKVNWSLSCCQGDGVSFTGKWYGEEAKNIIINAYNNNVPNNVNRIIDNIVIEFKRNDRMYSHEYTVNTIINYDDFYGCNRIEKLLEQIEKTVNNYRIEVCSKLEKYGYDEIENRESEESFIERCECNEYEFYSDGTMV